MSLRDELSAEAEALLSELLTERARIQIEIAGLRDEEEALTRYIEHVQSIYVENEMLRLRVQVAAEASHPPASPNPASR